MNEIRSYARIRTTVPIPQDGTISPPVALGAVGVVIRRAGGEGDCWDVQFDHLDELFTVCADEVEAIPWPFARPGSWEDQMQQRGIAVIGVDASMGGCAYNARYRGQVISKWARTEAEATEYLLARADEIDRDFG